MKSKKILALFASLLIFVYASKTLSLTTHAQQSTDLPSDLSLDLGLAKQNPAPDQKQIVSSQTQQAVIVANTGATSVVVPQDVVSPQAKTEPQVAAINPEQTTSEQVVAKSVTIQVDENASPTPATPTNTENQQSPTSGDLNNISPTSSDNSVSGAPNKNSLVPGTNVVEPDDNLAPADNSGNPNLPAPTPADKQVVPTSSSTDNSGNNSQQSNPARGNNDQQNIPLESQPQANPSPADQNQQQTSPSQGPDNSSQPVQSPSDQSSQPSSSDNSQQSQPSSNDSGSPSDSQPSSGDNSSVQGASTGPRLNLFQKAIMNIKHFFTGK